MLHLPYFWDEAGYYVPAARDLLGGSLIPHSTPSNAHPPLVLAWLALSWKMVGQSAGVTRCAMLLLAAFSLLGFFRLARAVSHSTVAAASTFLVALYPVFFAQSSLAQVDLPAAGLTFWGLEAYLRKRSGMMAVWFSLAALAKETAVLVPVALLAYEVWVGISSKRRARSDAMGMTKIAVVGMAQEHGPDPSQATDTKSRSLSGAQGTRAGSEVYQLLRTPLSMFPPPRGLGWAERNVRLLAWLLVPVVVLAGWYAYHYARTGFVFGNPEFFRYNVQATLHPWRIVLALLLRLWQVTGYLGLWVLTTACVLAMQYPPVIDRGLSEASPDSGSRPRIAIPVQLAFLAITMAYLVAMSIVGGAPLARYMLPIVPLVLLICVSTIWRRLKRWPWVLGVVGLVFVISIFVNPPYGFSPEDNLAYRDYIGLHRRAEAFLEARYPHARVLTAWPANDELSRPDLGYVNKPMQVVRLEDFTMEQLLSAAEARSRFDIALVFSTKYQPESSIFDRWRQWRRWKAQFFGYHVDLTPDAAASVLGGDVVFRDHRRGQWVAVIAIEKIEEATNNSTERDFGVAWH